MHKKITRNQLSSSLAHQLGMEPHLIKNIIHKYFNKTSKYLKKEKMQAVPHIGTFKLRWHESYKAYIPKFKNVVDIPAHYAVRFHAALSLQKQINKDIEESPEEKLKTAAQTKAQLKDAHFDAEVDREIKKREKNIAEKVKAETGVLGIQIDGAHLDEIVKPKKAKTPSTKKVVEKVKAAGVLDPQTSGPQLDEIVKPKKAKTPSTKEVIEKVKAAGVLDPQTAGVQSDETPKPKKAKSRKIEDSSKGKEKTLPEKIKPFLWVIAAFTFVTVIAVSLFINIDSKKAGPEGPLASSAKGEGANAIYFEWGDTLAKIAEREYDNPLFWPYIYFENEKTISSPFKLIPVQDRIKIKYQTNRDLAELYFELFGMYREDKKIARSLLTTANALNPQLIEQHRQNFSDEEKSWLK